MLDGLNQPPAASKWWQTKTLLMSAFLLDEAIAYFNIETHTPNNYIQYIICNFLASVALVIDQFYAIHLSPCASSHRPSAWPQHLFGETTLRSHRARQSGWPREFSKTHKLHRETIIKWWNSWIYRPSLDIFWENEGTSFSKGSASGHHWWATRKRLPWMVTMRSKPCVCFMYKD